MSSTVNEDILAYTSTLCGNGIKSDAALTTYMQREAPLSGNQATDLANVANIFQTHFEFAEVPADILAGAFMTAFCPADESEETKKEGECE